MWCFIFVESVHKQKCKNKHGFSVIFVINVIFFFFFFVLEQLLNYSFKMDTFLGQMTAVLLYTAGSLVHQLIIVITVYVTCVVFKAIDLYLSWFFICLSTFNSNKAEWILIKCQYVPMICFSFLGCSQHSQYVFSGTVPALPVSTGNTLTPTGHTGELH